MIVYGDPQFDCPHLAVIRALRENIAQSNPDEIDLAVAFHLLTTCNVASVSANVKEAITTATGIAAGLFGRIRPQAASKFLRDDYIVLSGPSIGYEMLHATALALRDKKTAELALDHFKTLTPMIVRLSEIVPGIIVHELTHDVAGVDAGAVLVARANTRQAWSGEHVHANG